MNAHYVKTSLVRNFSEQNTYEKTTNSLRFLFFLRQKTIEKLTARTKPYRNSAVIQKWKLFTYTTYRTGNFTARTRRLIMLLLPHSRHVPHDKNGLFNSQSTLQFHAYVFHVETVSETRDRPPPRQIRSEWQSSEVGCVRSVFRRYRIGAIKRWNESFFFFFQRFTVIAFHKNHARVRVKIKRTGRLTPVEAR